MKSSCFALLLVVFCQCEATYAATNSFDSAQLAYNLKTTVEAYEKIGRKDPRWDDDAKKCLLTFARIRASTNGVPTEFLSDLQTNASRVIALGCDDPLIRYLYFRFGDAKTGSEAGAAYGETA